MYYLLTELLKYPLLLIDWKEQLYYSLHEEYKYTTNWLENPKLKELAGGN